MNEKGKYIKSFLAGAAMAVFVFPRIKSKKIRQVLQMGLSKLLHKVNKL